MNSFINEAREAFGITWPIAIICGIIFVIPVAIIIGICVIIGLAIEQVNKIPKKSKKIFHNMVENHSLSFGKTALGTIETIYVDIPRNYYVKPVPVYENFVKKPLPKRRMMQNFAKSLRWRQNKASH